MAQDVNQRVEALEAHITHQDNAIDDLNEVLIKQGAEIRQLTDKLDYLVRKMRELSEEKDAQSGTEPPPPHY